MQELLKQNNNALCHEIEQLQYLLSESGENAPDELNAYITQIKRECDALHQRVLRNLKYLDLEQENLLKDILSETELLTLDFLALNGQKVSPILRACTSDRLSLKFLKWLHSTHPQGANIPAAICDGEFSIWFIQPATIYFTPCTFQRGLRNLPIYFHEFGHLLYTLHKPEMDALVNDLQEEIKRKIPSNVVRNDQYEQRKEIERDTVVNTWYEWAQECFCDAVGFAMCGPSFAYAFSMYLRTLGRSQYQMSTEELKNSTHPVTWIRVQLLTNRARKMGYNVVADDLEEKWNDIATVLGVTKDFGGFYEDLFLPVIQNILDDMITETSPREFKESEVSDLDPSSTFSSPVALLNMAWQKFFDEPDGYLEWEKDAITRFLNSNL